MTIVSPWPYTPVELLQRLIRIVQVLQRFA